MALSNGDTVTVNVLHDVTWKEEEKDVFADRVSVIDPSTGVAANVMMMDALGKSHRFKKCKTVTSNA